MARDTQPITIDQHISLSWIDSGRSAVANIPIDAITPGRKIISMQTAPSPKSCSIFELSDQLSTLLVREILKELSSSSHPCSTSLLLDSLGALANSAADDLPIGLDLS